MKKLLFTLLIAFASFASFASFDYYRITNAGGTITVAPQDQPDVIYIYGSSGVVLSSDWSINLSSVMPAGSTWRAIIDVSQVDQNGHNISFYGYNLTANQAAKLGMYSITFIKDHSGGVIGVYAYQPLLLEQGNQLDGITLIDGSVPLSKLTGTIPISSLDTLGRGRIAVGRSGNVFSSLNAAGAGKIIIGDGTDAQSLSVSGDATLSSSAVLTIDSTLDDSNLKTGAAIKRQKVATGSGSYVVVNNSSGYLSEEATLNPSRGGLGANVSGSTGFVTFSAGSSSVGAVTDSRTFTVSFEAGKQCNNRYRMPCTGTVTGFYAVATKAIANTDNGTIVLKNAAGTTMTGGTITFTASDPLETAYSVTPSANNTFSAGDILYAVTSKTTAGGEALITITYTRNN